MKQFNSGKFSGETYQTILFDGFTASETEYDYKFVDWHYHENPYFTLGILGNCREINKREIVDCSPDTLVFHNCHEAHCNTKSGGISRQFQLELSQDWCRKFEVHLDRLPNSSKILNPNIKLLFYNIYKESKLFDDTSNLTIDALLLQTFETMRGVEKISASDKPRWTKKIDEILHDNFDQSLTLQKLSDELNLHWAASFARFSAIFSL